MVCHQHIQQTLLTLPELTKESAPTAVRLELVTPLEIQVDLQLATEQIVVATKESGGD